MKPILEFSSSPIKQIASNPPEPTLKDSIRQRAFELYEQRGHVDGHELDDWMIGCRPRRK
jgi:hypothetical protein